jgi:ubiquinone/menaquinone biosynthesis C-methylase UbiE
MSGMLEFDERQARAVEAMYQNPDVTGQRAEVLRRLELRLGEAVLDVGAGPGLLLRDLALSVGPGGKAAGLDMSAPMIEIARRRCEGLAQVVFEQGDAMQLPFPDASFDVAVSTQVYEYVPDMALALRELHRVMKPGGRILILDTDWDSLVLHTNDRARQDRILRVWDEHLADAHLPATLSPKLRAAGFQITRREIIPLLNPEYHPNCFAAGILDGIRGFVAGRGGVTKEEADGWAQSLRDLGALGEFFFSINRYVFQAVKPIRK